MARAVALFMLLVSARLASGDESVVAKLLPNSHGVKELSIEPSGGHVLRRIWDGPGILVIATKRAPDRATVETLRGSYSSARPDQRGGPGRVARHDYEYIRCGTANVYGIVEPKAARLLTHATKNRKRMQFAAAMQRITAAYPTPKAIHIELWARRIADTHSFRI